MCCHSKDQNSDPLLKTTEQPVGIFGKGSKKEKEKEALGSL